MQSGGLVRSRPPLCRKLGPRGAMTFAFAFVFPNALRNHYFLMLCCFLACAAVILLSRFFSCSRLALAFSCCKRSSYIFHALACAREGPHNACLQCVPDTVASTPRTEDNETVSASSHGRRNEGTPAQKHGDSPPLIKHGLGHQDRYDRR